MIRLRKPKPSKILGEKWGQCVKCGVYADIESEDYCGRWYPESQLTRWKGKLYCSVHMTTKNHEIQDDFVIYLDEGDRGEGF